MADIEKALLNLDDLMSSENERVEVIVGERVEKVAAGATHHIIGRNIFLALHVYVKEHGIGEVFFDGLHYLMHEPTTGIRNSLMPDVSFVRNPTLPEDWNPARPYPGIPTLAVEVISPDDSAARVQQKVRVYLDKGTQQVWVAYPKTRELVQYLNDEAQTITTHSGSQPLAVDGLFPGLTLTPDDIFELPDWVGGST